MRMSYLPLWKFTDSCGQPRAPKTIHLGCGSSDHELPCNVARVLQDGHCDRRRGRIRDDAHCKQWMPSPRCVELTLRLEN